MNTARRNLGSAGTQTLAIAFGGYITAATGATETWNGTSWTTSPATLGTPRQVIEGVGTQTVALGFGGVDGDGTMTNTEEFNAGAATKTVTVS